MTPGGGLGECAKYNEVRTATIFDGLGYNRARTITLHDMHTWWWQGCDLYHKSPNRAKCAVDLPEFSGREAIIYSATLPKVDEAQVYASLYIGRTTKTLSARKKEHIYNAQKRKKHSRFYDTLALIGDAVEKVKWEVICRCPVELAKTAEWRHIVHHGGTTKLLNQDPLWYGEKALYATRHHSLGEWKKAVGITHVCS